ncbi:MAG: transcriptional regulator [Planctomycetota bacterium]|nr:transcriptional regulator [Planctomycetota bacterium]
MPEHAVLTAVGPDKPGLVDAVSKFILECGGNLEDSRMAVLGGEFAMLILVSGSEAAMGKVLAGAEAAGARAGLSLQARRTRAPEQAAASGTIPYALDAYSMDHPGIVQRISHFLAERGINVRALETRLSLAPVTGQPLFSLHATLDVPSGVKVAQLRASLEAIGADENIDVELKPGG